VPLGPVAPMRWKLSDDRQGLYCGLEYLRQDLIDVFLFIKNTLHYRYFSCFIFLFCNCFEVLENAYKYEINLKKYIANGVFYRKLKPDLCSMWKPRRRGSYKCYIWLRITVNRRLVCNQHGYEISVATETWLQHFTFHITTPFTNRNYCLNSAI